MDSPIGGQEVLDAEKVLLEEYNEEEGVNEWPNQQLEQPASAGGKSAPGKPVADDTRRRVEDGDVGGREAAPLSAWADERYAS